MSSEKNYKVSNLTKAKHTFNPVIAGYPAKDLKAGEELVLSHHEVTQVYHESINAFAKAKWITLTEVGQEKKTKAAGPKAGTVKPEAQQGASTDAGKSAGKKVLSAEDKAKVEEIKTKVKALEVEYKTPETTAERKNAIKAEIIDLKRDLKTLK